jgi:hypothetical protein
MDKEKEFLSKWDELMSQFTNAASIWHHDNIREHSDDCPFYSAMFYKDIFIQVHEGNHKLWWLFRGHLVEYPLIYCPWCGVKLNEPDFKLE